MGSKRQDAKGLNVNQLSSEMQFRVDVKLIPLFVLHNASSARPEADGRSVYTRRRGKQCVSTLPTGTWTVGWSASMFE